MGTVTTAALAGRGRGKRCGSVWRFLRRAYVPNIGGAPGSVERRAFWRFALTVPIANICGAIDVFLFLWFVAPLPEVADIGQVRLVNSIALVVTMLVTFTVCASLAGRIADPIVAWLDSGEPADEQMVRTVLRFPLHQTLNSVLAWTGSALVFALINAWFSVALGVMIGVAILLGGITTCGALYLLAEKAFHPITKRALAASAPRKPAMPGVDARVLMTFAVTIGTPLLAMAGLGVVVLCGGGVSADVSADKLALTFFVLAMAALTMGLLSMKLVARSFSHSLRSMREALGRVEQGDFSGHVPIHDGSEIGVLQAGFNSMVAGLREREELKDLFGRHVGEDVARSALERGAQLGGEQRFAAVLFVDLIGSTALASQRSPDDVMRLLNRYFGLVVEVADRHRGWVNKFEGDGALCVFGAPHDMDDPAGCALSAARELDQRLRAELPELQAAIGVSAGNVVAGNVGSAARFEYTVIGDPVNEAARLTQLAKSTRERVRASAETLRRSGDDERSHWTADGQVTLRGRSQPTQLVVPV